MKTWKIPTACFTALITLLILTNCSVINASSNSNGTLKNKLQKILDTSLKATNGTGVVCLIQTPSFKWIGASGFADYNKGISIKTADMLRIASMTKMYVSVVVQKLNEEGKLSLDDKISKYLPVNVIDNIPNSSIITVRQLLNMTSGIRSYTEEDAYNDAVEDYPYRSPWTPEEIVRYIYNKKAVFLPGKGWDYSNTNYLLLEMIIEKVSGTSLASEIKRIICNPLKLNNTFVEINEERSGGFNGLYVRGYDENKRDVTKVQDGFGLGDGGLIANADEVAKFLQALFVDETLLSFSSLKQMKSFNDKGNYGLGLELLQTKFGKAWGHNGSSFGFSGEMLYLFDRNIIFVILTNDEKDSNISDIVLDKSLNLLLSSRHNFL